MTHHKDGDPFNNEDSNLERLCKHCHHLRHHFQPDRLTAMRVVRGEFVRLVKRHDITITEMDAICRYVRRTTGISTERRRLPRKLPKVMTETDVAQFFAAIDKTGTLAHQLIFRILYYTGVRISELCGIKISDVYLDEGRIFIEQGKGKKDRYVLIPERFRLTLKSYIEQIQHRNAEQVYLFESKQKRAFSTRRIQMLSGDYSAAAGIPHVNPHLLRHQHLTFLTREGLSDSQIQLISGHASKKSLETYQHLSLVNVKDDYEKAMRKLEL